MNKLPMIRSIWFGSIILVLAIVSLFFVYSFPKQPLLEGISFSKVVYDENGHLLRLTLSSDEKYRLYLPLDKISKKLVSAALLQEDQYFQWHFGINPYALGRAIWQTYIVKSRRVGASTLTMQVARLRYNIDSKKIAGKILQIFRALQLEYFYSKNQILEAYLNLAPYGNNIEGVGAASLILYGKSALDISLPEALTLSVIPQNPAQRPSDKKILSEIRQKLFIRWVKQHPYDANKISAINLPVAMQNIHQLPYLAPHFVDYVLKNMPLKESNITTTLDISLQKIVERIVHQYINRKKSLGVYNTAVLLIDSRDMGVKALLGSADFFDKTIQGQIDGTNIKRSPGSTLKPFIYALAIDQGLIHPNTVLKDVPHSFGSYNPENFDYDFMGPIKAKDALLESRNIPAIFLADQLQKPNLYEFLKHAHVSNLMPESFYGLALVLGGAELSMKELASLYAMLVNQGKWQPLKFVKDDQRHFHEYLLSPEASFLVLDMLKNPLQNISAKTGTSSGYRDAWTIGVFGPYVLAVWIGNFNNSGNPNFVGKTIAAPLFNELSMAIKHEIKFLPPIVQDTRFLNLTKVPVCKVSGLLPNRYCHDTELTWFIPGKSPIKTDNIHREITINAKTGLRTCVYNKDTRFATFEFWPSDLSHILKTAGIAIHSPPRFDSTCTGMNHSTQGLNPQITSPQENTPYILSLHTARQQLIPFSAISDGDVRVLYWFLNEDFLGKVKHDKAFLWKAKPGQFMLRVVDDYGRSDARKILVKVDG